MKMEDIVEMAWLNWSVTSFGTNVIHEADFKAIFIMGFKSAQQEAVNAINEKEVDQ